MPLDPSTSGLHLLTPVATNDYGVSGTSLTLDSSSEVFQDARSPVDILSAERNFSALCRQLTEASSHYLAHSDGRVKDGEAQDTDEEPFDLLAHLRGDIEARDALGFFHKEVGVVFEDLSVTGAGGIKLEIRTFAVVLKQLLLAPIMPYLKKKFAPPPKCILHPMSGLLKAGGMCLVLGKPGSGCSTFLKVIANQRGHYQKVEGNVLYSGLSARTMAEQYKGEVVYNPEIDLHHPTLTAAQTIRFALATKTPSRRLPHETKKVFISQVTDLFLQMLGIKHVKNTLVGNELVVGCSGGERKRISIAEMMATRACVLSWDSSTRGLDASTALEYAKCLRIFANIKSTTNFVSLYQAGEGIYNQFDKVILLNQGRMVYFGPADEARSYMLGLGYKNLPRQTTADYLTGCTDPNERQFEEGFDVDRIPKTPEEMERAYHESEMFARMEAERIEYRRSLIRERKSSLEFRAAVQEDKSRNSRSKSPYTVSVFSQMKALVIRQTQLLIQDKPSRIFEFTSSVSLGFIVGSVFYNLPKNTDGAFTREGLLFLAMLFNVFLALSELPKQMMGRPIMQRQTQFCFYRPASLALANCLAEIPFSISRIFFFTVIMYFLGGLYRGAGAFFTCFLFIYAGYFTMSLFYRVTGAISFTFDTASRLASAFVIVMSLSCGYEIPVSSIPRGLKWVHYSNPLTYCFSALMANEFGRINFPCADSSIIPRGNGYPSGIGPNQICQMPGSKPGESSTLGEDYIHAVFGYSKRHIWRNLGILLGYTAFFLGLLVLAVEKLSAGVRPAITVYQKENAERKRLNEKLEENKMRRLAGTAVQNISNLIHTRKPLTWEGLTYDVSIPGGKRRLLDEIYGYVKPGTLTALMGSSGAGKTTLLDVLANRKTTGVVGGQIMIGGRAPGVDFQRGTAYCEQQDLHEWTATVREAFRFSAYLRQPENVPIEEKNAYVEEVIQLLEMEDLADAMIGTPGYGLDVEARKRVTIGVELAAKPQLLLFLDEPTSGLDGQSAYNIVRMLRKLANAGQAILCTIHQPNAVLFENFDRLLLLKRGGKCVYFGDIGKDSSVVRSYFERNGASCSADANPAEFMLEVINSYSSGTSHATQDWHSIWLRSPEHSENLREIRKLIQESSQNQDNNSAPEKATVFATSFWWQLKVVLRRTNISFYRNADYEVTRLFNHLTVGLIVGFFFNFNEGLNSLRSRLFSIFQAVIIPILIVNQVQPVFLYARTIYNRESSAKSYSPTVFAIGQFIAETPYSVACAVTYFLLWYYINGFRQEASHAGYAFIMVLLIELFSVTAGQMIASLCSNAWISSHASPIFITFNLLLCGITRPYREMPGIWRALYRINPVTWFMSGVLASELNGLPIVCREEEYIKFLPPAGQTCFQWAGKFVQSGQGYLLNPGASDQCRYCPFTSGDEYLDNFGISHNTRWRDLGIFSAFVVSNVIMTLLGATFLTGRYAKR